MVKALVCSTRIVEKVQGPPLRGLVQSAFSSAANLIFSDGFLLSLNACPPRRDVGKAPSRDILCDTSLHGLPLMPNGLLLDAQTGRFPFADLRAGMPVVLGAGWLTIEALGLTLECSGCERWNPQITRPARLDSTQLRANADLLAHYCQSQRPVATSVLAGSEDGEEILALAEKICGRGPGLTPGGDDFLAGWLAVGWLLYGPQPDFLAICQRITEIARQRTHALSQCWLAYAAAGDVATPIGELLTTLNNPDHADLEHTATHVLALGATSGYDLIQGIIYGIKQFPLF